MQTNDGRLVVIAGASRSGKTAYVKKAVKGERRIFAWDIEDQWSRLPGWRSVKTRAEMFLAMGDTGSQRIAYVAAGNIAAEFDFFCGCAHYAGRYVAPVVVVAEELADVTTPAKAPGNWGILLRRGLKRGITIYAISQRWAEADKTAVGNASEFVIFRQSSGDDVRYLARKTRVPEAEIDGLSNLEFVRYDAVTTAIQRGRLRF